MIWKELSYHVLPTSRIEGSNMKIRNIIVAIILSICIAVMPSASVSASDYIGLITKCSLNCTYSDGTLKIYAKTQASRTMDKIGFVNIIIQKSSDLQNWTDEKNIGDFFKTDKKFYTLEHSEKISGGFYYRIVCTHYANGKPFGSNETELQTAENISKSVWADAVYAVPTTSATSTTSTTTTTTITTASATTVVYNYETASGTAKASTATAEKLSITSTATPITTASKEKTVSSVNSPSTGVKLPISALAVSVIAVAVSVFSRKKPK